MISEISQEAKDLLAKHRGTDICGGEHYVEKRHALAAIQDALDLKQSWKDSYAIAHKEQEELRQKLKEKDNLIWRLNKTETTNGKRIRNLMAKEKLLNAKIQEAIRLMGPCVDFCNGKDATIDVSAIAKFVKENT